MLTVLTAAGCVTLLEMVIDKKIGAKIMFKLTQSLSKWLYDNHIDKMPLIMLGHIELFTEEMQKEYIAWCCTEEGRKFLKGGSEYKEEE